MKLYAFWKYADFPYILGGTVTKMLENGGVETKEYGSGRYYKPFKVLPLKQGLVLQQQLDEAREKFYQAESQFNLHWAKEGDKLMAMVKEGK